MRLLPALLAALFLCWPSLAAADERILHFLSDVSVQKDGSLLVTETIRIRSEGDTIQRGIQRDFPTRYDTRAGGRVRVGFDLLGVERDGRSEPWTRIALGNGVRIRIGDPDVLIGAGEHVYRIRYRTTRQLGYFADYDELYWNATGTGWTFPIDVAEARVRLPSPAPFGDRAVYTGPQGSTDTEARVVAETRGEILFRTTAPLGAYEGLTIAVAWPKGVVAAPGPQTRLGWWLRDNGPPAAALFALLGLLAYYFHAWRIAGRGPPEGTVVPLFGPPDDMGAAAIRYVSRMGGDNRGFAAAIVELGVRRKLRLIEGEKGFFTRGKTTLEKTGAPDGLPAAEAGMMSALFAGGDTLLVDDKYHHTFQTARSALNRELKRAYEGRLFLRNWYWSLQGLALLLGAVWLVATVILVTDGANPVSAWLPAGAPLVLLLAWLVHRGTREAGSVLRVLGTVGAILLGAVAVALAVAVIGAAFATGRFLPLLAPLLALPLVVSAFWWMAAPTRSGRAVMDRIEGFRHYLSVTEEERLETLHPPEKTPELFEKYLPHAIALGVENEWADRFAGVLAAAAAAGQTQTLSWYRGDGDLWKDPGSFAGRLGSSLTSSIASASTAPGSRSGSGGGGSSGGGGGGGGGSGW